MERNRHDQRLPNIVRRSSLAPLQDVTESEALIDAASMQTVDEIVTRVRTTRTIPEA